jgi:hypothetical protein
MARKQKDAEKPREGATLSIDVDSFVRTRDSVSSFHSSIPVPFIATHQYRHFIWLGAATTTALPHALQLTTAQHTSPLHVSRVSCAFSMPRDHVAAAIIAIVQVFGFESATRLHCCLLSSLA